MKRICVIGSLNVDLTVRLPRFHQPGETIIGSAFGQYAGGKGGNQAVAAARLGAKTLMVGKLGNDANGELYRSVLAENRVDDSGVETALGVPSGIALIEVDDSGENRIAIVQGTNGLVDRAQVDRLTPLMSTYDIFLLQLEIPMDTVLYTVKKLHALGKTVILDPAPAAPLPDGLLEAVDYLTPNVLELSMLSGMPVETIEGVISAGKFLVREGAHAVLIKVGANGSVYIDEDQVISVPGFAVNAVDTTAAGDCFNAAFACALARGVKLHDAMMMANAAGALSTTRAGAQVAMPSMEQVERLMTA